MSGKQDNRLTPLSSQKETRMPDGIFHDAHEANLVLAVDPTQKEWVATFATKALADQYVVSFPTGIESMIWEVVPGSAGKNTAMNEAKQIAEDAYSHDNSGKNHMNVGFGDGWDAREAEVRSLRTQLAARDRAICPDMGDNYPNETLRQSSVIEELQRIAAGFKDQVAASQKVLDSIKREVSPVPHFETDETNVRTLNSIVSILATTDSEAEPF